ncbi:MAG: protein kinase [Chloroflexi bacterium]|nr:protein kinase [Chloroflexota bacterium]
MTGLGLALLALAAILFFLGDETVRIMDAGALACAGLCLLTGHLLAGRARRPGGIRHNRARPSVATTIVQRRTGTPVLLLHQPAPRCLPRYRVTSVLSRTTFHEVALAIDGMTGLRCIIKRTRPGVAPHDLRREAGMLYWIEWARLPIMAPRYLDYQEHTGGGTLVMTYIDGWTLDALAGSGDLTASDIIWIMTEVCLALGALHRAGYVFQDLKPANLMLNRRGEPVLIDWGSARRVGIAYNPGELTCTPDYASIEQMRGLVAPSNDIYAVGCALAALVPAPSAELAQIIARATAPLPWRYATIDEAGRALAMLARRSDLGRAA